MVLRLILAMLRSAIRLSGSSKPEWRVTHLFCLPFSVCPHCHVQYDQRGDHSSADVVHCPQRYSHRRDCHTRQPNRPRGCSTCSLSTTVMAFPTCLKTIFHNLGRRGGFSLLGPYTCSLFDASFSDNPLLALECSASTTLAESVACAGKGRDCEVAVWFVSARATCPCFSLSLLLGTLFSVISIVDDSVLSMWGRDVTQDSMGSFKKNSRLLEGRFGVVFVSGDDEPPPSHVVHLLALLGMLGGHSRDDPLTRGLNIPMG